MFDKAKMVMQAMKIKRALESQVMTFEEDGILVEVSGDQKIKKLVVNGVENMKLVDILNKALKKSQESSAKLMQEMGMGLDSLKF
jgi:hypothetical protein